VLGNSGRHHLRSYFREELTQHFFVVIFRNDHGLDFSAFRGKVIDLGSTTAIQLLLRDKISALKEPYKIIVNHI
jgi:uncharacterized protein Yka (UPF0111/DUF47 family)